MGVVGKGIHIAKDKVVKFSTHAVMHLSFGISLKEAPSWALSRYEHIPIEANGLT